MLKKQKQLKQSLNAKPFLNNESNGKKKIIKILRTRWKSLKRNEQTKEQCLT